MKHFGFYSRVYKLYTGSVRGSCIRNLRTQSLCGAQQKLSWISSDDDASSSNPEKIFAKTETQEILRKLSVLDIEKFRKAQPGVAKTPERTYYRLATDEEVKKLMNKTLESMEDRVRPPPMMNPNLDPPAVLSEDPDIADLDDSKFIFTDISPGVSDRERIVVVRDPNGTLREATFEEKWQMNRFYYIRDKREVYHPPIFFGEDLRTALSKGFHIHILDLACIQMEPDDPEFVRINKTVFDDLARNNDFGHLESTRHYSNFVLYLALNKNMDGLILHFAEKKQFERIHLLIELLNLCHKGLVDTQKENSNPFQEYVTNVANKKKKPLQDILDTL